MRERINYAVIQAAVDFYEQRGYELIEVPWVVPREIAAITHPHPEQIGWECRHGVLVGSAEQSFLHLMAEGVLLPGRYVTSTPCFRDERKEELSDTRRRWFHKVELIDTRGYAAEPYQLLYDARDFLRGQLGLPITTVRTHPEYFEFDLECHGLELGSYGVRSYAHPNGRRLEWVYGTGCAEPRTSIAMNHVG